MGKCSYIEKRPINKDNFIAYTKDYRNQKSRNFSLEVGQLEVASISFSDMNANEWQFLNRVIQFYF